MSCLTSKMVPPSHFHQFSHCHCQPPPPPPITLPTTRGSFNLRHTTKWSSRERQLLSLLFLPCPPGCADCLEIVHPKTIEIYQCLPVLSQKTQTPSAVIKARHSRILNTRADSIRKTNCNPTDLPLPATKDTTQHLAVLL